MLNILVRKSYFSYFFLNFFSKALCNVEISWDGLNAEYYPSVLPPIFANEMYIVYAFIKDYDISKSNKFLGNFMLILYKVTKLH